MSKVKQFAHNFTPTFQASQLISMCNFPNEKTEIAFVLRYWPFSKYKKPKESHEKSKTNELRSQDKEMIKSELQSQFASGSINFDDDGLMDKINVNLAGPSAGFQLEWDDDSNETKVSLKKTPLC